MSAIKRYIESQATLIAKEYGSNVDDVIDEITSYIVDRGFSTGDAIQAVRANIAAAPLQLAVYKACGIPIEMVKPTTITAESVTCSDDFKRYSNGEVDLRAPNPIFPSLPMTESSARAIAEEIQEAIRRQMK